MATRSKNRINRINRTPGLVQTSSVMFKLTEDQHRQIQDRPYHCLISIIGGMGDLSDIKTIKIRTNYARVMSRSFNETETIEEIVSLSDNAIKQATESFKELGVVALPSSKINAIRAALGVADSVDDHSVRHAQYHAYVKAVDLIERDPVFRNL